MKKDEIISNIRTGVIKYPILRQGECFVGKKIFLYVLNENQKDMHLEKLFNSLEEGIEYYSNTLNKGTYFITCKEQKNIKEQKWGIYLEV